MRRLIPTSIQLLIIGFFVMLASCQFSKKARPSEYEPLLTLIDSLLQHSVSNKQIPGAAVYVSRGDQVLYHKAVGWRNMESGEALRQDDIFRIASMTKALTAVAVLQLVEQGYIRLDDELHEYIPGFRNPEILMEVLPDSGFTSRKAEGEITIRQLLTHSSGIAYGFQDDIYNALIVKHDVSEGFEDDYRTSQENIERLAELPLLFEPGERYVYSLSYDVLGVVIEQVTGLRFDRYIQEHILDPLGMNDSYFLIPGEEQYRLVKVYQLKEDASELIPTSYPDTAYPLMSGKQFFSGGSDLCSTAGDYAKFLHMLMKGGEFNGARILLESSVAAMLSKQTPFGDGDYDQGFAAWMLNETGAANGPRGMGSFEFGGFYDTFSWADPKTGLIAVMLLQMYPNNSCDIHWQLQEIIFSVIHGSDNSPPVKNQ